MTAQESSTCATLALAILLTSASGCSSGSTGRSTSGTPTLEGIFASAAETPRPPNVSVSDVSVVGDVNTTFRPGQSIPYYVGDSVLLDLVSPDQAYHVVLFIPSDIESGTYPIADSFAMPARGIAARFGVRGPTLSQFYESVGGSLTIIEAKQSLSGTFTFTAFNTFAGASVTVQGSFEKIIWGF